MAIKVNVVSGFDSRGLKQAQREIANFGKSISRVMDVAMAGLAAGSVAILATSVKAASNLEQQFGALDSVFKGNAEQMKAFSKEAVNLGLSAADAAQNATLLGTMLKGSGMGLDEVTSKTKKLTVLASDLAATYGGTAVDAVSALTATFRGEFDPIEKYGVSLKKSDINARLAAEGNGKLTGSARKLAEAQAAINLIFEKTTDAQGQSAREADTFAGRMARVTAQFSNLQVQIGEQLMPYVVELFDYLQSTDGQAEIQQLVEGFKQLATEVGKALQFIIKNHTWLIKVGEVAVVIWGLSKAFAAVKLVVDLVSVSMAILGGTIAVSPLGAFLLLLGGMVALYAALASNTDKATAAQAKYAAGLTNGASIRDSNGNILVGRGSQFGTSQAAINKAIAANNARSQAASDARYAALGAQGAAQGYGSTMDLYLPKVKVPTFPTIPDPTADKKSKAAAKAAAKKAADEAKAIAKSIAAANAEMAKSAQDAMDKYHELMLTYGEQVAAVNDYKNSLLDLVSATKPLAFEEEVLGRFASAAKDSFDAVAQNIKDNSKMFEDGGASLLAYVAKERVAIEAIAKQRDELAKKYSLAKAVKEDVQGSILAMANLNGLLTAQTETVTETMTSVVNGISLVRTRTFEQTKSTGDIVSGFKAILDKAKTFAKSLTELKKLGLNGTLFKQIVDSGAEAGTATADAIIAGGADAVTSLNDTFAELESVGASIGEQTAVVMYGAGVDLTNGLLEGIKSQDQKLIDLAKSLGKTFSDSFNSELSLMLAAPVAPVMPGTGIDATDFIPGYGRVTSTGTNPNGQPIIVNVNAGVIADKSSLPSIVTEALATAYKQGQTGVLTRLMAI